ncbi:TetR family transcriptional regulator [Novosphingobium resinovorum]
MPLDLSTIPLFEKRTELPKKVDHDQRRVEIARVIREITWNEGVEGLKIRNVADKVGYGPSVVVHYFENKREMLNFSQRESRKQEKERLSQHGMMVRAWKNASPCFFRYPMK